MTARALIVAAAQSGLKLELAPDGAINIDMPARPSGRYAAKREAKIRSLLNAIRENRDAVIALLRKAEKARSLPEKPCYNCSKVNPRAGHTFWERPDTGGWVCIACHPPTTQADIESRRFTLPDAQTGLYEAIYSYGYALGLSPGQAAALAEMIEDDAENAPIRMKYPSRPRRPGERLRADWRYYDNYLILEYEPEPTPAYIMPWGSPPGVA